MFLTVLREVVAQDGQGTGCAQVMYDMELLLKKALPSHIETQSNNAISAGASIVYHASSLDLSLLIRSNWWW